MIELNEAQIEEYVIGSQVKEFEIRNDDIQLTLDNDVVLIFTGGYCRDVYVDAKRRRVTFENLD